MTLRGDQGDSLVLDFDEPGVRHAGQQTRRDVTIVFDNARQMVLQHAHLILSAAGLIGP